MSSFDNTDSIGGEIGTSIGESLNSHVIAGRVPVGARLTVEALALHLGVDARTVHDWNRRHNLPAKQPGKEVLIDTDQWWNALPDKVYEPKKKGTDARKR